MQRPAQSFPATRGAGAPPCTYTGPPLLGMSKKEGEKRKKVGDKEEGWVMRRDDCAGEEGWVVAAWMSKRGGGK
ncbi:unnamed protein product [Prunus armeniaca]